MQPDEGLVTVHDDLPAIDASDEIRYDTDGKPYTKREFQEYYQDPSWEDRWKNSPRAPRHSRRFAPALPIRKIPIPPMRNDVSFGAQSTKKKQVAPLSDQVRDFIGALLHSFYTEIDGIDDIDTKVSSIVQKYGKSSGPKNVDDRRSLEGWKALDRALKKKYGKRAPNIYSQLEDFLAFQGLENESRESKRESYEEVQGEAPQNPPILDAQKNIMVAKSNDQKENEKLRQFIETTLPQAILLVQHGIQESLASARRMFADVLQAIGRLHRFTDPSKQSQSSHSNFPFVISQICDTYSSKNESTTAVYNAICLRELGMILYNMHEYMFAENLLLAAMKNCDDFFDEEFAEDVHMGSDSVLTLQVLEAYARNIICRGNTDKYIIRQTQPLLKRASNLIGKLIQKSEQSHDIVLQQAVQIHQTKVKEIEVDVLSCLGEHEKALNVSHSLMDIDAVINDGDLGESFLVSYRGNSVEQRQLLVHLGTVWRAATVVSAHNNVGMPVSNNTCISSLDLKEIHLVNAQKICDVLLKSKGVKTDDTIRFQYYKGKILQERGLKQQAIVELTTACEGYAALFQKWQTEGEKDDLPLCTRPYFDCLQNICALHLESGDLEHAVSAINRIFSALDYVRANDCVTCLYSYSYILRYEIMACALLARALDAQKELSKAIIQYQKVMQIYRSCSSLLQSRDAGSGREGGGMIHDSETCSNKIIGDHLAGSQYALSCLLWDQRRYAECQRTLLWLQSFYGSSSLPDKDRMLAVIQNNIALTYRQQKRHGDAINFLNRSQNTLRKVDSAINIPATTLEQDREILSTNLAFVCKESASKENNEIALKILLEQLERLKTKWHQINHFHPDIACCLNNLYIVLVALDRRDEARTKILNALMIYKKLYEESDASPEHTVGVTADVCISYIICLRNVGRMHMRTEEFDSAVLRFQEAQSIAEKRRNGIARNNSDEGLYQQEDDELLHIQKTIRNLIAECETSLGDKNQPMKE